MGLLRGGTIVSGAGCRRADVRWSGERIVSVAPDLEPAAGESVIDAGGAFILPGLVDPHLHIALDTGLYRTPDDWTTGTRTAALGGITTVVDFATQFSEQTYAEGFEARRAETDGKTVIDFGLHMMVTDRIRAGSMDQLVARGVGAVKVYTTYRPNYFQDDATLLAIMREAAAHGLLVMVHAENDALVSAAKEDLLAAGFRGLRWHGAARPEFAEVEAAHRCCLLAREAGCALYVVHNSSHRTVDVIAEAKSAGVGVYSETCPQYLTLDESLYESAEPWRYILQPPLRARDCVDGLWERLAAGAVDVVGTDHCDYSVAQKTEADDFTTTPGGLPGLDTLLPLLWHEAVSVRGLDPSLIARVSAEHPARIFGLADRKGAIATGHDADLVLLDPTGTWTVRGDERPGTAQYSPWEGRTLTGRIRGVWSRGERLVADGVCDASPGRGRYLPTLAS